MSSLLDIVVSFLAAVLSAAFLHFGAAEKPDDKHAEKKPEAAAMVALPETPAPEAVPAAVNAQSQSALPNMKFLAY